MKHLLTSLIMMYALLAFGEQHLNCKSFVYDYNTFCTDTVSVNGVVTAIVRDSLGSVDGFYLQSSDAERNSEYVRISNRDDLELRPGDEVCVSGNRRSYADVIEPYDICIAYKNRGVTPIDVNFPADFSDYSKYEGKLLRFNQTLVVTSNYNLAKYGQITLSSDFLMSGTEKELPGSDEWRERESQNKKDCIVLDDGSEAVYPDKLPWVDYNGGTIRIGAKLDGLVATLHDTYYGYVLIPYDMESIRFNDNERPKTPQLSDKNYNVKVCAFNLEYYLASHYGEGYGPDNEEEASIQHRKILAALAAIDADIYGLVEVQTGQEAIEKLCDVLNQKLPGEKFAYINDGTPTNGTYTKVGFIYKSNKVEPKLDLMSNDYALKHRKKAQCFSLVNGGGSFVFMLNHFKSKSGKGTGVNADNGDGQGAYNNTRVSEAESTISFAEKSKTYYKDNDILIMGDLNSYSKEDPIRRFIDDGYVNLVSYYGGEYAYTYTYMSSAGILDHAMANSSLMPQVADCEVFHINASEPPAFEYGADFASTDMYRSSDHDPVVVTLNLMESDSLQLADNGPVIVNNNNSFTVYGARRYYMQIVTLAGVVLQNKQLMGDEETFYYEETGLSHGLYILKFTEIKAIEPREYITKLIVK